MRNDYKRFVKGTLAAVAILMACCIALVVLVDPMMHYHTPWFGMQPVFENERYQGAGIARHFDYDTLVVGTSVTANFSTSQFDQMTGSHAAKLIYLGGFLSDFDAGLTIAFDTHEIDAVYWGIDPNIMRRYESERTAELPEYLYNRNPLDDTHYVFNKDILFRQTPNMLLRNWRGQGQTMDDASHWGDDYEWSKARALASYPRPELSQTQQPADALLDACDQNLAVVTKFVKAHPETTFHLFIAPYSVLFWDQTVRTGELDCVLAMLEHMMDALVDYDNVRLYFFMDEFDIVENLDNYTDFIHYSQDVNAYMAAAMCSGEEYVTRQSYPARLRALEDWARSYDYGAIFEN